MHEATGTIATITVVTMLLEPEICDGQRSWPKTQELFIGAPINTLATPPLECGWYSTAQSPYRGAFAMVQEGAGLDDYVGEFLRITNKHRSISVYCVGTSALIDTPIAITRRAFLALARLGLGELTVYTEILG